MTAPVRYEPRGAVGVITVDNPPVNAQSHAVRLGLVDRLREAFADSRCQALVVIGAGRTFMAGADIREFGTPLDPPDLNGVIAEFERSGTLLVAAIHGTALGGGLELALGCDYRCALPSAQVGFPEVKLGILPGAGGTQRLPRLIGVEPALEMIVSGDPVPAPRARLLGIIDEIVDGDLLAGAVAFAERLVAEGRPRRRISDMQDLVRDVAPAVFDAWRKKVEKSARGLIAPLRCIDSVQAATTMPFPEGHRRERELCAECMASPQSRAQIYVFFAEREVRKIPDVPKDTPVRPIRSAAVVGAGTMGGGIAMTFANAGIPVRVLEIKEEPLRRGLATIAKNYGASVDKGRLSRDAADQRQALIRGTLSYDDLADADIVVEAVFEEMGAKKPVFRSIDRACKPEAILASNTSTLDIDALAAETSRPGQVIGTHFFSPAHVMRLLEIVRGARTSRETIATTMDLAQRLHKVGVLVGNCDSFVGNRMLDAYVRQANFMLEEGALPQDVDRLVQQFGLAMGPYAMQDMAGLDVAWLIRKRQAASRPPGQRYSPLADRICELGRFGQKTGAGWYRYEKGSRAPVPDPLIEELIVKTSKKLGRERRRISDDEILTRCLYPLVNEGARILEEGIALRPGDIDVIYVAGYGFPAYRGGPMYHADTVGLGKVYDTMCGYHEVHGEFWEPAPLLARLAKAGKSFRDL